MPRRIGVSVLFSEPKIPQCVFARRATPIYEARFSALQRAENSSIIAWAGFLRAVLPPFQCSSASRKFLNAYSGRLEQTSREFQCSSASRKFLNPLTPPPGGDDLSCFSALQRAENSSIQRARHPRPREDAFQCSSASRKFLNSSSFVFRSRARTFQCSSASRKFLNFPKHQTAYTVSIRFSALQRAENSSIVDDARRSYGSELFQCSSASRKFLN